jgi:glycosyltransferase involved in cell wall biosynthesis
MTPRSANISVVITTYNRPDKLKRCLQALRDQELLPAEVIVVNDGSTTDYTYVQSWASEVTWIHQENAGVSAARNHGIGKVSTPYTCLCDDDDYFLPNHISTLDSTIQSIHEPTLLHTHRQELTHLGITNPEIHPKPEKYTNQEHYVSKGEMVICCTCFPTAAFSEFPFPDGEKYAEDHEQRLMAMSKYPVQSILDKTAVVDRTGESATSNILNIGPRYRQRFHTIFSHPSIRPHIRRSIRHRQIFRWTSLMMSEYRRNHNLTSFLHLVAMAMHIRSLSNVKTWALHFLWLTRR